ncbi:MAG TPA: DUF2273 domain-containing protein [Promicromonospora sp.]|nr:DUF2273 domain-containing protein [Promicromonospora sp.]
MTNLTVVGLLTGLLLTLAVTTGGFLGLLLAVVLGAAGLAVGAHLDGKLDLGALLNGRRRG